LSPEWFLFLLISGWLVYISRTSLRAPGSHGFFRFFAWECILALFLLNADNWFEDPFSPLHLASWFLLLVSTYLIVEAVLRLRQFGRQDSQRQDVPLIGIEKTTSLVTNGIYRYIRHPMYSSLLFLSWGIFLKDITWLSGCLVVAAMVFLFTTSQRDEIESLRYFGHTYQEYMRHTKRFIPFIY
jgi:protein-S-isoprenylcysteine O-methyltransferase Ste14